MVKIERTPTPPASLAIEKAKGTNYYRGEDVVQQLHHDFAGKCYLCEINELQSVEIEHLRPHHQGKDRDRLFDWNNLFYSCSHCNSIKNAKKYEEQVLDCCREDPECKIQQELIEQHVRVFPLDNSAEAITTASLIQECFEKTNTGIRTIECEVRVNALQTTMDALYRALAAYQDDPSRKNIRVLRGMLNRTHKFAGFTRTYVRQHLHEYPGLEPYVSLS